MDFKSFPESILRKINNLPYQYDSIGESASSVIMFDEMVLKIEKTNAQSDREYHILKWLKNKLPVPEIIEFERKNGINYLLMTKLKETMACDAVDEKNINSLIKALADGIKRLWNIKIDDCGFDSTLDSKLKIAKYNIDNNLVDVDDFNEETLGPDGFESVDELYKYLIIHKPKEDLVFSHGDYCLPNVFVNGSQSVGFLDLGKAGIADRWQDVALCVRSLKYNVCDLHNYPYEHYLLLKNKLYNELGIEENREKLKYYILLDELF